MTHQLRRDVTFQGAAGAGKFAIHRDIPPRRVPGERKRGGHQRRAHCDQPGVGIKPEPKPGVGGHDRRDNGQGSGNGPELQYHPRGRASCQQQQDQVQPCRGFADAVVVEQIVQRRGQNENAGRSFRYCGGPHFVTAGRGSAHENDLVPKVVRSVFLYRVFALRRIDGANHLPQGNSFVGMQRIPVPVNHIIGAGIEWHGGVAAKVEKSRGGKPERGPVAPVVADGERQASCRAVPIRRP